MSSAERLMTVPEVAERLSMEKTHVWRMVLAGKIPSYKIGRSRRVSPSDLDKYLESCRARPS
jgi:excisionase family DNA binding protein